MTINDSERRKRSRLSVFAKRLLEQWSELKLPQTDANIVVAVSGGADSVALLLGLHELIDAHKLDVKPIVAHLDHGLRKESRSDARWVFSLAEQLSYEVSTSRRNLKPAKGKPTENLEQAARKARYDFLHRVAKKSRAKFVLTAHTIDDQAETILMRLLRGSAAEGLSGTTAIRPLTANSHVQLVRPLINWARRADTEEYCRQLAVDFRIDSMNEDVTFSRVRVRKQLLPLMKSFNNRVVEALSRTASLLGEDASALSEEAERVLTRASRGAPKNKQTKSPPLDVHTLRAAPAAIRRRALREWILRGRGDLNRLEMVHLLAVDRLIEGDRGGRTAELPGGMCVVRRRGMLELADKMVEKDDPRL